jgi:beta-glucosidase
LEQEGLQADLSGWYAPALNTHRSPFGGRVYEYYSEDGLLAGKLAAAVVSGAGDQGLFSYIKHFALNEQETYRSVFLSTWANEQAVREIYLKPFEIAIKEAKSTLKYISDKKGTVTSKTIRSATAIMSAQNCIGGTIGFAHYGLLTEVLRNEWGFKGAVVTDLYPSDLTSLRDMTLRAGGDLFMNQKGYYADDYDSTTSRSAMRHAIHNIAYMVVNSSAMNGIAPGTTFWYEMSPWKMGLLIGDIIIGLFTVSIIIWMVLRYRDEKIHPDKYLKKGEKNSSLLI